jgi:LPXTG-site transpeptidase (sortase) family protein
MPGPPRPHPDQDQTVIIPAVSVDQEVRVGAVNGSHDVTQQISRPGAANLSYDATQQIARIVPDDTTQVIPAVGPDRGPGDQADAAPARQPPPRRHRRPVDMSPAIWLRRADWLTIMRSSGEVMITLGLVLLLFAPYEVWGKAAIVGAHQATLDDQLSQEWSVPTVTPDLSGSPEPTSTPGLVQPPPPGWAIARMYIPKLGKHWVVVEGVDLNDIKYAPGHYPGTAMPGQVGNFSVAGHRSPAIFWDLDKVKPDDIIVVETRSTYFIYEVTRNHIVRPSAVEVIAPVPGSPGKAPVDEMLTITTCNPKWDNYERLIVHARLLDSRPRAEGPPPELATS